MQQTQPSTRQTTNYTTTSAERTHRTSTHPHKMTCATNNLHQQQHVKQHQTLLCQLMSSTLFRWVHLNRPTLCPHRGSGSRTTLKARTSTRRCTPTARESTKPSATGWAVATTNRWNNRMRQIMHRWNNRMRQIMHRWNNRMRQIMHRMNSNRNRQIRRPCNTINIARQIRTQHKTLLIHNTAAQIQKQH